MATKIFVNLAVKDLTKSMNFFKALGYSFNSQFSDDTAACLIISEDIYAMLITHPRFKEFTPKAICDSTKSTEALVALSCEKKEDVAAVIKKALAAGGKRYAEPKDYGFMVQDGFEDPDGHIFEYFWMDPNHVQ